MGTESLEGDRQLLEAEQGISGLESRLQSRTVSSIALLPNLPPLLLFPRVQLGWKDLLVPKETL